MAVRAQNQSKQLTQGMLSVAEPYRRLIPDKKGESLDEQILPWSVSGLKKNFQEPLEIHKSDPSTISNIMNMMTVEMQHWMEYSSAAKWVEDKDLKNLLNKLARAEGIHHMMLMSLLPKHHDPSEAVLDAEIALMSAYGICIDREPSDIVSDAFTYMFQDHLAHAEYAATIVKRKGCDVDTFTGGADLRGGRPLNKQFMKAEDLVCAGRFTGAYDKNTVDPITLINIDMIYAGEVGAWDNYMGAIFNTQDQDFRLQYAAFQSIEGQHVSICGSLQNPSETPLERMLVHEAVEISTYSMLMNHETNDQVKEVFQDLYREDLEHGRLLGQFAR